MIRSRACRALAAVALLVVSACGSSAPKERPLTTDEADRLAGVLFANHEAGGATFTLNTTFTGTGSTLAMSGIVDWSTFSGQATVTATGQESGVTEVFWNQKVIVERRPALDAVLAATGRPGARYMYRAVDTGKRQLDRAIGILLGLASAQRENAILISQKEGSAFLRTDKWRGETVDVLRYGSQNRFWLQQGTSVLRRFDGNAAAGGAPIIIDFLQTGKRSVSPPPQSLVVSADEIKEAYAAAAGG